MINKTTIPLIILEVLQPILASKGDLFKLVPKEDALLYFADMEPGSSFYFSIKLSSDGNSYAYRVELMPGYEEAIKAVMVDVKAAEVKQFFDVWINRLERYRKVSLQPEDPIIDAFAEDYYHGFELTDSEAEMSPLKPAQILYLDEYLEKLHSELVILRSEENQEAIEDIIEDINAVRGLLTNTPKATVIRKLSRIWAKITKQGVPFIKALLTEARKQLIQQAIKVTIEHGGNLLN